MNRSESIKTIAAALLKAQKEMGNALKSNSNPFFKSAYADLNAIREASMPVLNAHNISVLQPTVEHNGKLYVETMLLHESGEWMSSLTEVRVSKENDPQAMGSGISYARRYGLQSFVSLGAVDDDGESAMNRAKPSNNSNVNSKNASTTNDAPATSSSFQPKKKEEGFSGPKKKETSKAETTDNNTAKASNGTVASGSWG